MRKKLLITGGSGFIGSRLIPLVTPTYDVHLLSRHDNKAHPGVTYHQGDLREGVAVPEADIVVHLASVIDINASLTAPRSRLDGNVSMDLSLLEALRGSGKRPRVIYASTDRVYGMSKKRVVREEDGVFPIEPYTASKIIGEEVFKLYSHLYDIPYIVLRIDSVYGPGQPRTMFISDVIQKMHAGDEITTGPLKTRKNFVYVDDVANAILCAILAPEKALNQAYNVGSAHVSMRDVVRTMQDIFAAKYGRKVRVKAQSKSLRPSKTEVQPFALSTEKARRLLKWRPQMPLYKGLEKTIQYFDV